MKEKLENLKSIQSKFINESTEIIESIKVDLEIELEKMFKTDIENLPKEYKQ